MNIGILGYGKLGRGVHLATAEAPEVDSVTVFTNREPREVSPVKNASVLSADKIPEYADKLDILFVTHKSLAQLPREVPNLLRAVSTVDAMDAHGAIGAYLSECDAVARGYQTVALVGAGWDPGLLSASRALFHACFSEGDVHTFWGYGVSEGHSTAVKSIPGVKDAVSYTKPSDEAKYLVSIGKSVDEKKKHKRICYVTAERGWEAQIEATIKEMPYYFKGYETEVVFEDEKTFAARHGEVPHKGQTLLHAKTGENRENAVRMHLTLEMASNPEFTGAVMLAYGRAAYRLRAEKRYGAYSPLDVPPSYLCPMGEDATKWL